jgi:hypothetical protein
LFRLVTVANAGISVHHPPPVLAENPDHDPSATETTYSPKSNHKGARKIIKEKQDKVAG